MRLIDADEFFKDFTELEPYEHISHEYDIDAVQVVKCKDCKYCNGEYEYCYIDIFVKPDGYCSYGEKTEVNDDSK